LSAALGGPVGSTPAASADQRQTRKATSNESRSRT
jgi:hypothetical protein